LLEGEAPLETAKREFAEELGNTVAPGNFISLGALKQPSGKQVIAWALRSDLDTTQVKSNCFSIEWPPKSGRMQSYPEIDKAEWFSVGKACEKIARGQQPFLSALTHYLDLQTEQ